MGLKRSIADSAEIKQFIRQDIIFAKAVAQDNGFEFRRARTIASLNFEHSRDTIRYYFMEL